MSTAILRKGIFFRVTVRYDLNVFLFLKPWCTLIKSWHFPPITKSVHFIHLSLLIIYKRKRLMAFLVNKNAATIYAGRVLSRVFKGSKLPPTKSSHLPRPPPPPKKKRLLSLQCFSNYIGRIIWTRRGQFTHCNLSQNCVSKCTKLHLSAYSFQRISGGAYPDPPKKVLASAARDFSPKR